MHQLETAVAVDKARSPRQSYDLGRVIVCTSANGYVTNLPKQVENNRDGDPATLKLMGYRQLIRGRVAGVARGIDVLMYSRTRWRR